MEMSEVPFYHSAGNVLRKKKINKKIKIKREN